MSKMPKKKGENTETPVKTKVKTTLEAHKWFWWMPPQNGFGKDGVSDFIAYKAGVLVAAETKWHDRSLTTNQRAFLNSIRAEGGFGFVVRDGIAGSKYDKKGTEWLDSFFTAFHRAAVAAANKQIVAPEDGAMMLNAIAALTEEL